MERKHSKMEILHQEIITIARTEEHWHRQCKDALYPRARHTSTCPAQQKPRCCDGALGGHAIADDISSTHWAASKYIWAASEYNTIQNKNLLLNVLKVFCISTLNPNIVSFSNPHVVTRSILNLRFSEQEGQNNCFILISLNFAAMGKRHEKNAYC